MIAAPTADVLSALADMLNQDERPSEAERALRDACLAGADLIELHSSLEETEVEQLRRYGLESDGRTAAPWHAPKPAREVRRAVGESPPFVEWFGLPFPRPPEPGLYESREPLLQSGSADERFLPRPRVAAPELTR